MELEAGLQLKKSKGQSGLLTHVGPEYKPRKM